MKSEKQKKRKTDLAPGTLDFPEITPQPINTIHMSLGFASGTLSYFLFEPEVLLLSLLEQMEENRRFRSEGGHGGGGEVVGEG